MIMFRRHDRYVLRNFWATFFAILIFFTAIVIVLDGAERISKVTRHWDRIAAQGRHPMLLLGEYYLTLIPFMWMRLVPFCVPSAAAFCLARLIRYNELTPLLTCGVSQRRISAPILLSGLLLVIGIFVLQEKLVPKLNRRNMELWRTLTRNSPDRLTRVPHVHDQRGGRLSMQAYLPFQRKMEAAAISFWEAETGAPKTLFWYPELAWNDARSVWIATHGGKQIPLEPGEDPGIRQLQIKPGATAPLDGSADLIEISATASRSLSLSIEQVTALEESNANSLHFTVLKHQLLTAPLMSFVLLLFSIPFSFRVARRTSSTIPGMLGALLIGGLYFGAGFLTGGMARAGDWNPIMLTWLPTVLFTSLGLSIFITMDG